MFKFLYNKYILKHIQTQNSSNVTKEKRSLEPEIVRCMKDNMDVLKKTFESSTDVIFREFALGNASSTNCAIVFCDGLTERKVINDVIMKPLMKSDLLNNLNKIDSINEIKNKIIPSEDIRNIRYIPEVIDECLSGNVVFFMDGSDEALTISSKGPEERSVEESKTDAVVRGPRVGFSENITTNMSLIRQRIRSANLKFETMNIGSQTETKVCIVYVKGIVKPELVTEVKKRLNNISIDAILESGYIEQLIEDSPNSIFPTVGNSEKPDSVTAKMLEGRVCILVDGTPFTLTVPMLFVEGFQSVEDYYSRPFFASMIRILRFLCFSLSVLSPAIYVMLATFHQELVPTTLLFTMAAGREGVPFPAIMEAGLMIITFEILREAGVRLPRPVGQAVSIVGALVIGEAAVSAGLVGGLLVIVVAFTAVSSFVVPTYTDVGATLRIVFLILAGFMGIFGIGMGMLVVLVHVVSLNSFGTPYLSPLAPYDGKGLKDVFIRAHLWRMNTRPPRIGDYNPVRQEAGIKPESPSDNNSSN